VAVRTEFRRKCNFIMKMLDRLEKTGRL